MNYIYDLHKTLHNNKIILAYEGEFTQQITKQVLNMAERNLESQNEELGTRRKVFNVMVECLQNIIKHSDEHDLEYDEAIFLIGMEGDSYIVISGNYMYKENIDKVKGKIDEVNKQDKDGLKAMYKEQIKNGRISERGGAGLGFIDMARKSGNKLEYDFQEVDDKYAFFSLKTKISRKKKS